MLIAKLARELQPDPKYSQEFNVAVSSFNHSKKCIPLSNYLFRTSVLDFNRVGLFRVEKLGFQFSTRLNNTFQPDTKQNLYFKFGLSLKINLTQVENLGCNFLSG